MGKCEDGSPSLETQNEIDLGSSSNGTLHDVVEDDDDDHHQNQNQNQNQDQNQPPEEETPTIDEKLESLKLQGNGGITNGGKEEEREEKEEQEQGKRKTHDYSLRPNAVNCTFYVKTGTCKFGLNCRFNHPPKRVFQAVGEKDKGIEECNGLIPDTGKIECKYFSMPGGCKYGDACRYNHSGNETKDTGLNFLGLPIRPLAKECTFYMRNGSCGYGANCRFHHPNPTEAKESDGNSLTNGHSLRGDNSSPKTYGQSHSFGVLHGTSLDQSNGVNLRNTLPYDPSMISYHQGMPQNPGWNQTQVSMSLPINRPPLPHQIVNNFSKTIDPSAHYEHLMQIEEFPDRPGQPNCDYYMKTGDCKYRSACRYNHPLNRAPKIRLPPLSANGSYSKSTTVLPVTTEIPNSNKSDTRRNGVPSAHHQQMQNGEFPERHGQPECEYFMKTGNCRFRSECRYHHPKNRVSKSSPCAFNEKRLPLIPGGRICRNYEQQGTCKYGRNCLFHHPDDSSPAAPVVAPQDHGSTDDAVAADLEIPANNNAESDWGDGWAM